MSFIHAITRCFMFAFTLLWFGVWSGIALLRILGIRGELPIPFRLTMIDIAVAAILMGVVALNTKGGEGR